MSSFSRILFAGFASLLLISCEKEPLNQPPIVDAGKDRTFTLSGKAASDTIILNGSASDTDGVVTAYLWSQISGPNAALIETPGSPRTVVSNFKAGSYVFQLMATDEKGATGVKKLSVTVHPPVIKELVLRPGAEGAHSSIVAIREGPDDHPYQTKNKPHNHNNDLFAGVWTYGSQGLGTGINRTYFKFNGLSAIPSTAEIVSAKLSLYGVAAGMAESNASGNSTYPGSPYNYSGPNTALLKRVTGDWSGTTITWNNKPGTTDVNQVEVPASDKQWGYNVIDLDVTNLVKDMVSSNQNYGFSFEQKTEAIYRALIFGSSKSTDPSVRPRLVVVYK